MESTENNENQPLPPRLVTHRDCMDGSACAVLFRLVFPGAEVVFVAPSEAEDVPCRDQYATIFADVCPSTCLPHEVVLDHHRSSFEKLREVRSTSVLDESKCGARLLYDHLSDVVCLIGQERWEVFRVFCDVVDDYDRWQLRLSRSKDLARLHQFLRQHTFIRAMLDHLTTIDPNWMTVGNVLPVGWAGVSDILERNEREYSEAIAKRSFTVKIPTTPEKLARVVYAEDCMNEVAQIMLRDHPDCAYAVIVNLRENKVSLRSRTPDDDCSKISSDMGGGGHPCAGGFPIDQNFWYELREII